MGVVGVGAPAAEAEEAPTPAAHDRVTAARRTAVVFTGRVLSTRPRGWVARDMARRM
jgi:hypothetical protein